MFARRKVDKARRRLRGKAHVKKRGGEGVIETKEGQTDRQKKNENASKLKTKRMGSTLSPRGVKWRLRCIEEG